MRLANFPFVDRKDAGRILGEHLRVYQKDIAAVFAIPRGGVPVAVEVAGVFSCELDIIVPRKIPIPSNTEAGYGAVTEDGVIVLNNSLVRELQLTRQQIERTPCSKRDSRDKKTAGGFPENSRANTGHGKAGPGC